MSGVIYADILFILNVYITYALLMLTAMFLGVTPVRLRLLVASIIGGISSFIIFIPEINDALLGVIRLALCIIFCFVGFSCKSVRQSIRQIAVFLGVNFLFAGLMFAIWYFVSPTAVYYNTGVIYFDIDALSLVVITAVCYFAVKVLGAVSHLRTPHNILYDVTVYICDDEFNIRGFLDTGNSLKDPFTSVDVIVVSRSALQKYFPVGEHISEIMANTPLKMRFLPCNTVSGSKLLPVFKADKVKIKGISTEFVVEGAMIAVSDENIKNGDFQALLPMGIFQNNYSDKGEDYEENKRLFDKTRI